MSPLSELEVDVVIASTITLPDTKPRMVTPLVTFLPRRLLPVIEAFTVPGVKGLTNSIIVEPAFTRDHKLSEAVWNVLQGVPTLNGNDTLRVNVKNSVVKLEGVVEHSIQKEAAEKAVASVSGVATVINLIEVKSQVSGESVTETVREKLLQEGVQVQP